VSVIDGSGESGGSRRVGLNAYEVFVRVGRYDHVVLKRLAYWTLAPTAHQTEDGTALRPPKHHMTAAFNLRSLLRSRSVRFP
jgi:hypothetical protein